MLQLVAEGKTAKEIGNLLDISVKTVEFHKASIMDSLGIRTVAGLRVTPWNTTSSAASFESSGVCRDHLSALQASCSRSSGF